MSAGYTIELDLRDRTALVVGLGEVGRRKALGLLKAGARVIGVDPAADPRIDGLDLRAEPYRVEHLAGVSLAFATGPPALNRQVVADAKRAGVWVNSASEPLAGDFKVPAVWQTGSLTLTVSTGGASPALAAALRDRAATALGASAAGLAAILAEMRPIVLSRLADDPEARRRLMADWADPRWLDLYARDGPEGVRREIIRVLDRENPA